MNSCGHIHNCFECGKEYKCEHPECQELKGRQRICERCSYLHGWAQAQNRSFVEFYFGM
jgi:hypothetical protein